VTRAVEGHPPAGGRGQARTRLARAAVVDAAGALFLERGYAGTTIDAISDRSDVPPATIYRLFSSKLGILKAVLDVSIAGDDAAVAIQDRPAARAVLTTEDPKERLAGLVTVTRDINSRAAPVYQILVSAAEADPEAAALLAEYTRQRHEGQRQIARSLARSGVLRAELRARDAEDIIHALVSPEVYRLLVVDRGWAPERYAEWLSGTLIDQLLDSPSAATTSA
jgi:AcrR family transcriptional regulator